MLVLLLKCGFQTWEHIIPHLKMSQMTFTKSQPDFSKDFFKSRKKKKKKGVKTAVFSEQKLSEPCSYLNEKAIWMSMQDLKQGWPVRGPGHRDTGTAHCLHPKNPHGKGGKYLGPTGCCGAAQTTARPGSSTELTPGPMEPPSRPQRQAAHLGCGCSCCWHCRFVGALLGGV